MKEKVSGKFAGTLIKICLELNPEKYQLCINYNVPGESYAEDIVLISLNQEEKPWMIIELKQVVAFSINAVAHDQLREVLLYIMLTTTHFDLKTADPQ